MPHQNLIPARILVGDGDSFDDGGYHAVVLVLLFTRRSLFMLKKNRCSSCMGMMRVLEVLRM